MTTLELKITGMSCGHCVRAVTAALEALDGVQVDDVRLGGATLRFDAGALTPEQVAQAVTAEGYAAAVAG